MFAENDLAICHPSGTSPEFIELRRAARGGDTFQREPTFQIPQTWGPSLCDSGHLATAHSALNLQLLAQRAARGDCRSLRCLRADRDTKMWWVQVAYLGTAEAGEGVELATGVPWSRWAPSGRLRQTPRHCPPQRGKKAGVVRDQLPLPNPHWFKVVRQCHCRVSLPLRTVWSEHTFVARESLRAGR